MLTEADYIQRYATEKIVNGAKDDDDEEDDMSSVASYSGDEDDDNVSTNAAGRMEDV